MSQLSLVILGLHPSTVTEYGAINLEELGLERVPIQLKYGDEIDRLPLPTRLKYKLKINGILMSSFICISVYVSSLIVCVVYPMSVH